MAENLSLCNRLSILDFRILFFSTFLTCEAVINQGHPLYLWLEDVKAEWQPQSIY